MWVFLCSDFLLHKHFIFFMSEWENWWLSVTFGVSESCIFFLHASHHNAYCRDVLEKINAQWRSPPPPPRHFLILTQSLYIVIGAAAANGLLLKETPASIPYKTSRYLPQGPGNWWKYSCSNIPVAKCSFCVQQQFGGTCHFTHHLLLCALCNLFKRIQSHFLAQDGHGTLSDLKV